MAIRSTHSQRRYQSSFTASITTSTAAAWSQPKPGPLAELSGAKLVLGSSINGKPIDFGALACGYTPVDLDTFAMDNGGTK